MTRFFCPYLKGEVELTPEREKHIAERHPDLFPEHQDCISATLGDPDLVRRSARLDNARLFSRWFETVRGGKHVVVVILSSKGTSPEHFIITAYMTRRLAQGATEWQRS